MFMYSYCDYVLFWVIFFIVFCVFVCKCVLYYYHRVSPHLQLTNISHFHCPTVHVAILELTCSKIFGYELMVGVTCRWKIFFLVLRYDVGAFVWDQTRVELQRRGICVFYCYYGSTLKCGTVDVN